MPVIATRPTFCAKAVAGKVLKIGATAEDTMSARRPSPTRLESTSVPTTSPTARMSAVVSTMITRMTMVIDTIAPIAKIGEPKAKGVGTATTDASATPSKSVLPTISAATVPTTSPSRIDSRDNPGIFVITSTARRVNIASPMLPGSR
jgi:hypothetical protein